VEVVHAGRSIKADLLGLDLGDGPIVVKDFGNKNAWVRSIGRLQIARELRAYRALEGVEGIPALLGRVDHWALAIERVNGAALGLPPEREIDGPARFERLARIVAEIHARGVLHLDLRALRNVLVREDGRVFVIDFAAAVRFRPGGLLHRIFFGRLSRIDRAAVVKWKKLLNAGPLTPEETRLAASQRRWGSLWPFNRSRRQREPVAK
jgi:hypothetical protein